LVYSENVVKYIASFKRVET